MKLGNALLHTDEDAADGTAGDGRDAPQLRRLFEPLFDQHIDHNGQIHRRHHHKQPPRPAQQAQRHAVVRDVVQLEPAGDERDGLPLSLIHISEPTRPY